MLVWTWLFVGGIAALATVAAVLTEDDGVAIVTGVLGFIAWAIWTYGALNVEVVTDSGGVETFAAPAVALLGVVLALLPGYIALTGPIEIIGRVDDTTVRDV